MSRIVVVGLLMVVICLIPAQADVVQYSATLNQTSHYYSTYYGDYLGWATASAGLPNLTADFTADKQLRITYSAPAGMQFVVSPRPTDATTYVLRADLWSAWAVVQQTVTSGDSLQFTGFSGSATNTSFNLTNDSTNFFAAGIWRTTTGFSFQSLTMLFNVPSTYNGVFNNLPVDTDMAGLKVIAYFPDSYTGGDPGQLISLSPIADVPEPASVILLVSGFGLGMFRRLRR